MLIVLVFEMQGLEMFFFFKKKQYHLRIKTKHFTANTGKKFSNSGNFISKVIGQIVESYNIS